MKDLRNTTNLKPKQLKIKAAYGPILVIIIMIKKLLLNQREKTLFCYFLKNCFNKVDENMGEI